MNNYIRHPYHLVDESPWPLISATGAFFITSGLVKIFHFYSLTLLTRGLVITILVIFQWWRDVSSEASFQGLHTLIVQQGMRWGIILFIVSEVFFFVSFFWAFFHNSLSPAIELGAQWPPNGILTFNPFEVPFLNTLVLVSSGITATWSHHALLSGNDSNFKLGLFLTIFLGGYFTILQAMEYLEASFRIADSCFGSTFFVATGFHGLHVIVGSSFLVICLLRGILGQFNSTHHFGYEASVWYWHFVDVVWLFLFLIIYWWRRSS